MIVPGKRPPALPSAAVGMDLKLTVVRLFGKRVSAFQASDFTINRFLLTFFFYSYKFLVDFVTCLLLHQIILAVVTKYNVECVNNPLLRQIIVRTSDCVIIVKRN